MATEGNSYFHDKKYDQALACYSTAIARSPNVATLYTNRALCYLKLEQWSSVVEDCRKAIRLDTSLIKAHHFMGQALIELEKYDDAIICLKTAHELAKQQQKNFGEDITSAVRYAKKLRWKALELRRLKQESELQSFLTKLLEEHRQRLTENCGSGASPEVLQSVHQECSQKLGQLNSLFEVVDAKRKCREVPDYLCGKISFDLMTDPCITPSGITYDRKDIEEHLERVGHFDPVTRQQLTQDQLYPNLAMKEVVDAFVGENGWVEDY